MKKYNRILVVYYSRTGNTRAMAEMISAKLDSEIEELNDETNRDGILGYLKGGMDASRKKTTAIAKTKHNPADFDLVIIGTPVWAFTLTPAIRAYLETNSNSIKEAAFFCSMDGSGHERTFTAMETLLGKPPVAVIETDKKDRASGIEDKIHAFVEKIQA